MNYSCVIQNEHDLIYAALLHTGAQSLTGAFTLHVHKMQFDGTCIYFYLHVGFVKNSPMQLKDFFQTWYSAEWFSWVWSSY